MIFEKHYLPQFREADRDGLVGLRGYMNYFQDVATHYMHNLNKGNDTLPEEYGIVWTVFTDSTQKFPAGSLPFPGAYVS